MVDVVIRAATEKDYAVLREGHPDTFVRFAYGNPQRQSVTFWTGDTRIATFGAVSRWPGVADLWGLVSPAAQDARFALVRMGRTMLDAYARETGLRRMAAWVHAEEPRCAKFARLFGFVEEYRDLRAAPDGGDLLMFVRRWNDGR